MQLGISVDGAAQPCSGGLPAQELCPTLPDGTRIVINLSGRGDKDVQTVAKAIEGRSAQAVRFSD